MNDSGDTNDSKHLSRVQANYKTLVNGLNKSDQNSLVKAVKIAWYWQLHSVYGKHSTGKIFTVRQQY